MKNLIKIIFTLFLLTLVVVACSKESEVIDETTDNAIEIPANEKMPAFIAIQPLPVLDLVIASYTTNIVPTTTGCGGVLPDVSCMGQRSFMATVVVVNNGPTGLPAGSLSVDWTDTTTAGSSTQRQTLTHGSIPAGGTLTFTRPYWMGPCGCVPPFTYFPHTFIAQVDPANLIPETNNNNNFSPTYSACDGC